MQAQSQLKAIYRDNADTIVGNCDTTLFLGGKEKTTLKEMAELLGKETIDFKKIWIKPQKLSEIILGMANIGGGVVIFGVEEKEDGTIEAVGLEEIVDKEKQDSKISRFLPDTVKFNILDFDLSGEAYSKIENKMYQMIKICFICGIEIVMKNCIHN